MRNWRRRFTLIELLLALAVIAILVAIAVPAIHSAREMARKTQCRNRLKQLGVALQNHQSQFGHLPEDGQNGYGFGVFLSRRGPEKEGQKRCQEPLLRQGRSLPGM